MSASAKQLRRRYAVALLLAVLFAASPAGADDPAAHEAGEGPLPDNFGRMEDWLYRGAAPGPDQLRSLARLGVQTIIDLRHPAERGYGARVRQLGMDYVRIPLPPRSVPTEEQLQLFLSLLAEEENRPLYVHCRKGRHRAGLMLALYRVLRQGATTAAAMDELQAYGFGRGHRRMAAFFHCRTRGAVSGPGRTGEQTPGN